VIGGLAFAAVMGMPALLIEGDLVGSASGQSGDPVNTEVRLRHKGTKGAKKGTADRHREAGMKAEGRGTRPVRREHSCSSLPIYVYL
jgi:hypothetical protein